MAIPQINLVKILCLFAANLIAKYKRNIIIIKFKTLIEIQTVKNENSEIEANFV